MQVTKEMIQVMDPDQLSDGITTGKKKVTIQDIETGLVLAEKLFEALAGRGQLRRKVAVLENIVANQQKVLEMLIVRDQARMESRSKVMEELLALRDNIVENFEGKVEPELIESLKAIS